MNRTTHSRLCGVAFIAALSGAAALTVAQTQPSDTHTHAQDQGNQTSSQRMSMASQHQGMSDGSSALHESMMKGMQSMQNMQMTGDTDKDFASMMIQHHQQAISMAQTQVKHGKSPELRQRAQKIIDDSRKDIDELKKWNDQAGGDKSATGKR